MPTYEYVCKNCGETIEVFQSFSDKPLKKHKECGGALQKVFHARGIVFKGGGFYATDSKPAVKSESKSDSDSKKSEKPEKAKAGASTSTSSSSSSSSSDD
jgi:putative FmdB family regulatory protein